MAHKTRNRSLLMMFIGTIIAVAHSPGTFAKTCSFSTGIKTFNANLITQPLNKLNIPADAPVGTVIFKETVQGPTRQYSCSSESRFGFLLNPKLGSVSTGTIFPLGKTGLSLKIFNHSWAEYLSANGLLTAGKWTDRANYSIEIIKSSELSSQNVIDAGYLGAHVYGNLELARFNLLNPIILNSASCQTPPVQVEMGDDYSLEEFAQTGDTPRIIKFNIDLKECQAGIKTVTYSLKENSQVFDQTKGLVALSPDSTAKGVGLQLMSESGQPLALNTTYTFSEFDSKGTNFKIPLSAAYYRLASTDLEAGTANASVTFIVNYL